MSVNYADDILINMSDTGMTSDLQQLVYDDVQKMSDMGVENDRERNLFFYLDNFCDDLCNEFGYSDFNNRDKIVTISFNSLKGKEDIDLTKIREAVYMALKKLKKKAYPNTMGVHESNAKPKRDVDKWVKALGEIYAAMREGETRESANQRITEGWSPMDTLDFKAWARYYEAQDHEKYGINRTAAAVEIPLMEERPQEVPRQKELEIKTPESTKVALISRFNAAEKLLYQFVNVWPPEVFNRLHQGLSDLKREVMMLKSASMVEDCIIRTAGMWELNGFPEGADVLKKIAQPPEDLASQIERALSGREYKGKPSATTPVGGGLDDLGMGGPMPPPGELEGIEGMEGMEDMAAPAGAAEELPAPEKPPAPQQKPEKEEIVDKEVMMDEESNPFSGKTVQDVLEVLEPLSQQLSERQFVRALAKADMMLDSLNIASHFPELGEATAKALELNIYVGTRISKIIEKLKGGLKEKDKEKEKSAPNVEMEELLGEEAPTPGPEEEAFEVTEEETPKAPTARGK
jgi:hypothetical protein